MSGYIGTNAQTLITVDDVDQLDIDGFTQGKTITESVYVNASDNMIYFGDTTFANTVTVLGTLVLIGGDVNFQANTNIIGSLNYR